MKSTPIDMEDVLILEPTIYRDERGGFFESFNQRDFNALMGSEIKFVQDNQSISRKNVIRGLHYQVDQTQAKLIRVLKGIICDVVVDLRKNSKTFGEWTHVILSAENKKSLWIPEGFAHGFSVLSDEAEVLYKVTDYWSPTHERCINWNDPKLAIDWQLLEPAIVSMKDQQGVHFGAAEVFE